jgi:hypothetical protein
MGHGNVAGHLTRLPTAIAAMRRGVPGWWVTVVSLGTVQLDRLDQRSRWCAVQCVA